MNAECLMDDAVCLSALSDLEFKPFVVHSMEIKYFMPLWFGLCIFDNMFHASFATKVMRF